MVHGIVQRAAQSQSSETERIFGTLTGAFSQWRWSEMTTRIFLSLGLQEELHAHAGTVRDVCILTAATVLMAFPYSQDNFPPSPVYRFSPCLV
jgi:hypothetical protein